MRVQIHREWHMSARRALGVRNAECGVKSTRTPVRNKANSRKKTRPRRPRHEPPCGVTTSRANYAKQSQTREGWDILGEVDIACDAVPRHSGACETKPILLCPDSRRHSPPYKFRGERGRSPYCAKQSQFGASKMSANCYPGKGLGEKQRTRAFRETKPISGSRLETAGRRRPPAWRAKQSQFKGRGPGIADWGLQIVD